MRFFLLTLFLMSVLVLGAARAGRPAHAQENFRLEENIPYADVHSRQVLDVYLPAEDSDTPYPVVYLLHGGGLYDGDKSMMSELAVRFAEAGYAAVNANYRLIPAYYYPAYMEDTFCALAWIHAQAEEYHFDTEQVVVLGYSAGGYLAMMAGLVDEPEIYMDGCAYAAPPPVQGVVLYAGAGINAPEEGEQYPEQARYFVESYLGQPDSDLTDDEIQTYFREMSPLRWVDADDPRFLMFYGLDDEIVPSDRGVQLFRALEAVGIEAQLFTPPGVEHFNMFGSMLFERADGTQLDDIELVVDFVAQVGVSDEE